MIVKDPNLLRSLLTLKGLYRNVDIAKALRMHENSVARMFRGLPVYTGTAERVSEMAGIPSSELFKEHTPKEVAVAA